MRAQPLLLQQECSPRAVGPACANLCGCSGGGVGVGWVGGAPLGSQVHLGALHHCGQGRVGAEQCSVFV